MKNKNKPASEANSHQPNQVEYFVFHLL